MRILVSVAQIPFVIWLLIAGALAYMDYSDWETTILQPLISESEQKSSELEQLVSLNTRAQEFDTQRVAKLKELQDLGDQFRETAGKIPRNASVSALLKSFADVADSIGIDFNSYRPQAETEDSFVRISPIDVSITGTYPQVMSFLDAVANMERIVHSKQIVLATSQKRGGWSRLSSKIVFETYSISQESIDQESKGTVAIPPVSEDVEPPVEEGG